MLFEFAEQDNLGITRVYTFKFEEQMELAMIGLTIVAKMDISQILLIKITMLCIIVSIYFARLVSTKKFCGQTYLL